MRWTSYGHIQSPVCMSKLACASKRISGNSRIPQNPVLGLWSCHWSDRSILGPRSDRVDAERPIADIHHLFSMLQPQPANADVEAPEGICEVSCNKKGQLVDL